MINLKQKKIFVCGVTGSGKTYFIEHKILNAFKKPFVYAMHKEDFTEAHKGTMIYHPQFYSTEALELFIPVIKKLAYENKIDAFVLDEADMFIPKNLQALQNFPNIYDMFINHRHWNRQKGQGIALILASRRPQEMNTIFIEQAHHLFVFALEGKNVIEHLSSIHKDFEILMPQISHEAHNYIHKEIGKPPVIYEAIKQKVKGGKNKNG